MLPKEVIDAVFPPSAQVGEIHLEPMTMYHIVAMEALGIEVGDRNLNSNQASVLALWILSQEPKEMARLVRGENNLAKFTDWVERHSASLADAHSILDGIFKSAFLTFVPAKQDAGKIRLDDLGEGYGWPIEIAEAVAHEHSRPFDEVMQMPLVRMFALICAMRQRNGGEAGGPDYYDRIRIKAMKERMRAKREAEG